MLPVGKEIIWLFCLLVWMISWSYVPALVSIPFLFLSGGAQQPWGSWEQMVDLAPEANKVTWEAPILVTTFTHPLPGLTLCFHSV